MTYSFTEKKRIRKSFGKRPSILRVPNLLATQKDSYRKFCRPMCRRSSASTLAFRQRSNRFPDRKL